MQLIRKYKTNQQLSDSTPPPLKQKLLQILREGSTFRWTHWMKEYNIWQLLDPSPIP
jgi:hypothetical protein